MEKIFLSAFLLLQVFSFNHVKCFPGGGRYGSYQQNSVGHHGNDNTDMIVVVVEEPQRPRQGKGFNDYYGGGNAGNTYSNNYLPQNRQLNGGITLPGLGTVGFNLGGFGQQAGFGQPAAIEAGITNVLNSFGLPNLASTQGGLFGGQQSNFGQPNYGQPNYGHYPQRPPPGSYHGNRPQGNYPPGQQYPGNQGNFNNQGNYGNRPGQGINQGNFGGQRPNPGQRPGVGNQGWQQQPIPGNQGGQQQPIPGNQGGQQQPIPGNQGGQQPVPGPMMPVVPVTQPTKRPVGQTTRRPVPTTAPTTTMQSITDEEIDSIFGIPPAGGDTAPNSNSGGLSSLPVIGGSGQQQGFPTLAPNTANPGTTGNTGTLQSVPPEDVSRQGEGDGTDLIYDIDIRGDFMKKQERRRRDADSITFPEMESVVVDEDLESRGSFTQQKKGKRPTNYVKPSNDHGFVFIDEDPTPLYAQRPVARPNPQGGHNHPVGVPHGGNQGSQPIGVYPQGGSPQGGSPQGGSQGSISNAQGQAQNVGNGQQQSAGANTNSQNFQNALGSFQQNSGSSQSSNLATDGSSGQLSAANTMQQSSLTADGFTDKNNAQSQSLNFDKQGNLAATSSNSNTNSIVGKDKERHEANSGATSHLQTQHGTQGNSAQANTVQFNENGIKGSQSSGQSQSTNINKDGGISGANSGSKTETFEGPNGIKGSQSSSQSSSFNQGNGGSSNTFTNSGSFSSGQGAGSNSGSFSGSFGGGGGAQSGANSGSQSGAGASSGSGSFGGFGGAQSGAGASSGSGSFGGFGGSQSGAGASSGSGSFGGAGGGQSSATAGSGTSSFNGFGGAQSSASSSSSAGSFPFGFQFG